MIIPHKENINVITAVYPDLSINKQLYTDAHTLGWKKINVSTVRVKHMSEWWVESPAIDTIVDWVVRTTAKNIHYTLDHTFTIVSTWFAKYSKDDFSVPHHHIPTQYSFVYYVRTPPNSSPLLLPSSNTEIPVEEGLVVILPMGVIHGVDKCPVDDRLILAGNFYLTPPGMTVHMDGYYEGFEK
jgi:hypothetical protein